MLHALLHGADGARAEAALDGIAGVHCGLRDVASVSLGFVLVEVRIDRLRPDHAGRQTWPICLTLATRVDQPAPKVDQVLRC